MDQKGATFMKTATILRENEMKKVYAMQKYVATKRTQAVKAPDTAKDEARSALVRSGVMTKKGNPKKVIVSWE